MLVADARKAVEEQAPLDRVRSLSAELQQLYHGLAAARREPPADVTRWPESSESQDDDVIDADFTVS
jgi:molecular chaperone DnaK